MMEKREMLEYKWIWIRVRTGTAVTGTITQYRVVTRLKINGPLDSGNRFTSAIINNLESVINVPGPVRTLQHSTQAWSMVRMRD